MNRLKYSVILLAFSCFLLTPLLSNASIITYFGPGAAYEGQNNMFAVLNVDSQLYHWFTTDPASKNSDGTYQSQQAYYNINSWYFTNESKTLPISYGTSGMLYLEVRPDGTYGNPEIFLFDKYYGFNNPGTYYSGYFSFLDQNTNYTNSIKLPDKMSFSLSGFNIDSNYSYIGSEVYTVAAVPEPSTMILLGSGLAGLVGYGRKRLKK